MAGDANEDQILIAAHVCMDNKQELLQKVLSDLYHVFRYENCHRMDQALCTVLEAMEKHPAQKHIQISGRYNNILVYYIFKKFFTPREKIIVRLKKALLILRRYNSNIISIYVLQCYIILYSENEGKG